MDITSYFVCFHFKVLLSFLQVHRRGCRVANSHGTHGRSEDFAAEQRSRASRLLGHVFEHLRQGRVRRVDPNSTKKTCLGRGCHVCCVQPLRSSAELSANIRHVQSVLRKGNHLTMFRQSFLQPHGPWAMSSMTCHFAWPFTYPSAVAWTNAKDRVLHQPVPQREGTVKGFHERETRVQSSPFFFAKSPDMFHLFDHEATWHGI